VRDKNSPQISVVVPVFNEKESLPELLTRLGRALPQSHEILLVDDGSSDSSWDIIRQNADANKQIRGIKLSRNFGHQVAVSAGLDQANGDAVIVIDADLQDPPEVIGELILKWEAGFKVVYGRRRNRQGDGFFKKVSAAFYYRLLNRLSDYPLPLDVGDFRLMERVVVAQLRRFPERNRYLRGLIAWIGFPQTFVDFDRDPRFGGDTKYPLRKMLRLAIDGITSFSRKPLRMALGLGLFSVFVGLLLVIYVLISKFLYPETTISGWASMLMAVIFFGGVQLITLGILGEYIGRIFDESKERPLYITETDTGKGENQR
jgi:glycosyltransferase involved in cell wall biosynthesis